MRSIGQIEHRFVGVDIAFQDFADSSFGSPSRRPNLKEIGVPTRIVGVREIPPVIDILAAVRVFGDPINRLLIGLEIVSETVPTREVVRTNFGKPIGFVAAFGAAISFRNCSNPSVIL